MSVQQDMCWNGPSPQAPRSGLCKAAACGTGHHVLAEMVHGRACRHCPAFPGAYESGLQLYIALCPAFFAINNF